MPRRGKTPLAAGMAALLIGSGLTATLASPGAAADAGTPYYTVVSHPDFLNSDIGDLSSSPAFHPGDLNGINEAYTKGLATVLDQMQAENPDSVLVAGDLVEGHWGQDVEDSGIFGPVGTDAEKRQAIRNAGTLYYRQWLRMFTDRGLDVYPAVGDHDIGDNPWRGSAEADFKRSAMDVYKDTWTQAFTMRDGALVYPDHPRTGAHQSTAYAVRLAPEIQLVTVDEFKRTATDVERTVDGEQLAWLDGVLSRAEADGVDWIIVQGHVPVLGPVRARHSSRLRLAGGAASAFWRVLADHHVDLYLDGEVHDTTAVRRNGVTQISHGGLFYKGESSYLVGRFYPDRLDLEIHDPVSEPVTSTGTLWATTYKRPPDNILYTGANTVVGTMSLTPTNQVLDQTGMLAPYTISTQLAGVPHSRTLTHQGTWAATSDNVGAEFEFRVKDAKGSTSFGTARTTAWSTRSRYSTPVYDGHSTCAQARSRVRGTELLSAWTSWRCVTAPYDGRVLVRRTGTLVQGTAVDYYRGTRSLPATVGTVLAGPRVHASVQDVAIRLRVGPRAGRLALSVGGRRLATLDPRRPDTGLRWFTVSTGPASGRLTLRTVAPGKVWVDAIAVEHTH